MKNGRLKTVLSVMFILFFLLGLALILIPELEAQKHNNLVKQEVNTWIKLYKKYAGSAGNEPQESPILPELLMAMQEYNQTIYENGQSGLVDAWSYQSDVFDLTAYGAQSEAAGVITIPKIEVELPLYLGASYDNLAKGFAQLSQTSMPIGGAGTNCVIACHRGYNGAAFLRDADRLEVGDAVYLQNFWETLTYKVCETKIINPDETDEILIQPNRDLITIITCTPYRVGSHRLLIFCERTTG